MVEINRLVSIVTYIESDCIFLLSILFNLCSMVIFEVVFVSVCSHAINAIADELPLSGTYWKVTTQPPFFSIWKFEELTSKYCTPFSRLDFQRLEVQVRSGQGVLLKSSRWSDHIKF